MGYLILYNHWWADLVSVKIHFRRHHFTFEVTYVVANWQLTTLLIVNQFVYQQCLSIWNSIECSVIKLSRCNITVPLVSTTLKHSGYTATFVLLLAVSGNSTPFVVVCLVYFTNKQPYWLFCTKSELPNKDLTDSRDFHPYLGWNL